MKNGELNPCYRQEKLERCFWVINLTGWRKPYGDYSMELKSMRTSEHARLVVLQGPRDTVKAALLESQSPGMEAHIHRHSICGRGPRDRTVSISFV